MPEFPRERANETLSSTSTIGTGHIPKVTIIQGRGYEKRKQEVRDKFQLQYESELAEIEQGFCKRSRQLEKVREKNLTDIKDREERILKEITKIADEAAELNTFKQQAIEQNDLAAKEYKKHIKLQQELNAKKGEIPINISKLEEEVRDSTQRQTELEEMKQKLGQLEDQSKKLTDQIEITQQDIANLQEAQEDIDIQKGTTQRIYKVKLEELEASKKKNKE